MAQDGVPREYFVQAYGEYRAPWELDTPQPALIRALEPDGVFSALVGERVTVLDMCCGVGKHSAMLARKGCDVIGVDLNAIAIKRAKDNWQKLSRTRSCKGTARFFAGDLLDLNSFEELRGQKFDVILDAAAFHCFSLADRPRYMAGWAACSRPGTRLLFLNFSDPPAFPGVGPRQTSERELREDIFSEQQGWRLRHVEMSEYFHYPVRDGHGHPAWLAIAERL